MEEIQAATLIQKTFRGHLSRKKHLPQSYWKLYFQCKKAIDSTPESIPQARDGETTVYLPKEMPQFVLKQSGEENALKRYSQMQEVRSILREENSPNLVIPEAFLCGDFLIENRLPIDSNSYHNMGLYISNPHCFDDAIRELTRLFSKRYLDDLIDCQLNLLTEIVDDFVRYDNLPLYIVEEDGKRKGKIGLIDLENTKLYMEDVSRLIEKAKKSEPVMSELLKIDFNNDIGVKSKSDALNTLARIFPYHVEIIKEEAKKLSIEIDEDSMQKASDKGKKYLNEGHIRFLEWVKNKGVTQTFKLDSRRRETLADLLKNHIQNDEEARDLTGKILTNLERAIQEAASKLKNDLTDSEIVSLRSLAIPRSNLLETEKGKTFISILMNELVKGGELYYFKPACANDLLWVRF